MTIEGILCRIMGYDKYVKGKDLLIADALSRSQTYKKHLAEISEATEQDTDLQFVIHRNPLIDLPDIIQTKCSCWNFTVLEC